MATQRERQGRPTQFHGVPLEERAVDSQGNRLPWALEWADGHESARHQKRQPEEKGSFGKATRRKGSSRATRTQTPAKKENPALDGFEAALRNDTRNDVLKTLSSANPNTAEAGHPSKITVVKEPTQVALYGFPPEMQWAAMSFYEKVSGGMICEDYEREPPAERRRYQSGLGHQPLSTTRPLTREEKALSMQYHGGECWIKVTFDSSEAADRAVSSSPHVISGYWVYAQIFKGQAPDIDLPILVTEGDRQKGPLGALRPPQRPSTLGSSSGLGHLRQETGSKRSTTLPRSFRSNGPLVLDQEDNDEQRSESSMTVSSATVTAPEYSGLRERHLDEPTASTTNLHFTHFPETPRTILRPAAEALLPQSSWWERILKSLTQGGWIPGDLIGHEVPRLEDDTFDWASASFYWRSCWMADHFFGTDICGLKDE